MGSKCFKFHPQRYVDPTSAPVADSCENKGPQYASISSALGSFAGPTGATGGYFCPLLLVEQGVNNRFAVDTVSAPDDALLLPSNGDYLVSLSVNVWFRSLMPSQWCTYSVTPQIAGQQVFGPTPQSTTLTVASNVSDQLTLSTIVRATNGTHQRPPLLQFAFTQSQPVNYNSANPTSYGAYLSNLNATVVRI